MALEALGRKNLAGPLLLLNLVLYIFMLGFASWALDSFIDGHQYYLGLRGNDATLHFVQFAVLAAVVGVAAKLATAYHARAWRPQGLAAAASLGTVAWAATALAFGLACKEMRVVGGGERGWRLRALEGLTATLAFTQLLYVLLLHAAVAGDRCGLGCPADDDQPRGPCSLM
ncbi:membrane protein PM19L-like isoform X2 [Phragmites australis]|uniref:membrane protein PM19L-like isoform X2 n=1 Tax=Phragmites australis TaxID=29695 RepID=UPI002D77A0EA|nr:membrane protein PM19L-like isoform X2 [Phragmites australis]